MIQFKYDGVDMISFFKTQKVYLDIGNEREITFDDSPKVGVNVQEVKQGAKIIRIKFALLQNDPREIERVKHQLAGMFDDKIHKLEFNIEPDKYYLGMLREKVTPDYVAKWYQTGELEFIVPDGVAHSTTYKRLTKSQAVVSGKKATFTIQNDGNQPAIPIITANHTQENGYLGIVNATGAFEVGDVEETDGFNRKKSQVLRDYKTGTNIISGLSHAQPNEAVLNDTGQNLRGTVSILNLWGRPHMHLSNNGGTTGNNGGSVTWTIPADTSGEVGALNEYLWWRQIFWAGSVEQYGFIKVMVSDTDGKFLYGVETFKRSKGEETEYNFLATDGEGGYDVLKRWSFRANNENSDNPFNQDRGFSDLLRRNDMVQVYFFGTYHKINVPDLVGKKSAKIHVSFGSVGNKPLVTHMYLDQIMYRKDFVNEFVNVPNRYTNGTSVVANFENDTLFIDNKIENDEVVHGSMWHLNIPPGKSTLDIYCSDWAEMPDVAVSFEERWI